MLVNSPPFFLCSFQILISGIVSCEITVFLYLRTCKLALLPLSLFSKKATKKNCLVYVLRSPFDRFPTNLHRVYSNLPEFLTKLFFLSKPSLKPLKKDQTMNTCYLSLLDISVCAFYRCIPRLLYTSSPSLKPFWGCFPWEAIPRHSNSFMLSCRLEWRI